MGGDVSPAARFGAVSFVQRFGSALNAHTHLHCCVTDSVFSLEPAGTLQFHTATDLDAAALSAVQRRIRCRLVRPSSPSPRSSCSTGSPRWFRRRGVTGITTPACSPRMPACAHASPPELETEGIDTAAFAFDQSLSGDPITPPPDPGFSFDQTLN